MNPSSYSLVLSASTIGVVIGLCFTIWAYHHSSRTHMWISAAMTIFAATNTLWFIVEGDKDRGTSVYVHEAIALAYASSAIIFCLYYLFIRGQKSNPQDSNRT